MDSSIYTSGGGTGAFFAERYTALGSGGQDASLSRGIVVRTQCKWSRRRLRWQRFWGSRYWGLCRPGDGLCQFGGSTGAFFAERYTTLSSRYQNVSLNLCIVVGSECRFVLGRRLRRRSCGLRRPGDRFVPNLFAGRPCHDLEPEPDEDFAARDQAGHFTDNGIVVHPRQVAGGAAFGE
jgi:hypothetical protein